ncbi:polyphosphate polymerase domain-containing protein [Cryobacterium frigoriphilum]|uniref:Polyphosphate polymerase domain-containing protein n=2 Tax=Cryobacterium frigoriphilum TaxID=1259150 RepID=A0A4R9A883_9MICO|nr:polyphosphate polymerase domain-containing protein [Cryobacterium frigoriphilum]
MPGLELPALEPIGLEELTERASLQTRVDRKYVLPLADLDAVLVDLADDTRVLDIGGVRAFAYESIYFDTPERTSYFLTAQPRRRRFKIRTRTYLDSAATYLEVKTRGGRSVTVKERLPYDTADGNRLTPEGRRYADQILDESGIGGSAALGFTRALTTRYRRTTLYLPASESRATIDTDLSWVIDNERRLDLPELTVVETKSGARAGAVDRVLWAHGHRPAVISKFGTGMAALCPELPANRWVRVLSRYIHQPAPTAWSTR